MDFIQYTVLEYDIACRQTGGYCSRALIYMYVENRSQYIIINMPLDLLIDFVHTSLLEHTKNSGLLRNRG